jgi:hypothetical protein
MRAIIMLSPFIGYICVISMTIPAKMQSMRKATSIAYNYKPSLHRVLWENCDLYYVGGGYLGEIAPDTNIAVIGNHYFHSIEKRVHRLGIIDTDIRIVGAHTIFISDDKQIGNARITNYDGTVTIYNDKRSIELETNETLLIDKDGNFEKFTNEFASTDSLWLTAGEIWLSNVDIPTLIKRMAINFGCKVQFNYLPSDERVINAPNVFFDCKSGSLYDGVQILQSIATDSQKFSYYVKNGIIFIDKYNEY